MKVSRFRCGPEGVRALAPFVFPAALALAALPRAHAALILDEPLQGSTTGTRSGGELEPNGWRVTGKDDFILWHVPTVREGATEWDVKGLRPGECRAGLEDHGELFHMYDHTYASSDTSYNPGYRDNPFKHFVRKQGCIDIAPGRVKYLLKIGEGFEEIGTSPIAWDAARTYRFRVEWGPEAGGRTYMKLFRDGALLSSTSLAGEYAPAGHSVRIGASTRRDAAAGAPIDAVFSNLKVWDLSDDIPAAPVILRPTRGSTVRTQTPFVEWRGDSHQWFQVRVTTSESPETGIAWDSGEVQSGQDFTFTGILAAPAGYQVFARLGSAAGWGPWSAPGHSFTVDTSGIPPEPGRVSLAGNSLSDGTGPFLGLGVTYFSAMRIGRSDRTRLRSDLEVLRGRGFRYIRALSMVGWNSSWQGIEIPPVAFTSQNGTRVDAWPDYWQQFRDLIDIVHEHGMRTQVTIFADAQLMPEKPARIEHMRLILENLAGREHKVILLEVANEAWQNGFPGDGGIADLREFGKYLADRTSILVALSAPLGGTNEALTQLYAGSAADIATEHFTRDTRSAEGGWLPVRECWRAELASGVPPVSSNEPIGPGSSVAEERDPIKLAMAAVFAWGANLPMYVWHPRAGIRSLEPFQGQPGLDAFVHALALLPPDLASWVRNDGLEEAAPFTAFAGSQANRYWPDAPGAQTGAVRNTGSIKGSEFVCLPIGILDGGLDLEARRPVAFEAFDPLTGAAGGRKTLGRGQRIRLPRGPGAWIVRGTFTDTAGVLAPPLIQEVDPDPDSASPGIEYSRQLALEEGYPPPAWEIVAGPSGIRVDSSGRVSGWTPAAGQVGERFSIEVRAVNSEGADSESWTAEVVERTGSLFPFDEDAEGWALAAWKSGPYDPGTIGWEAIGGDPGGNIRVEGSGDSNNQDTCTREGGTMTRVISTAGLRSIRIGYDVLAALQKFPGGSGAGACAVLEGSIEDKLVVYRSSSGLAGPWTVAQAISEPDLPGAWRSESIDLSGNPAVEDNPQFALRFQWQLNARGDVGRIDNVRVEGAVIRRETPFHRGDPNADGRQDISDALSVLGALFLGGPALSCEKSADANDSGGLDLSDPVYFLNYLFLGGAAPRPPFPDCGVDPTPDALGCETHACG